MKKFKIMALLLVLVLVMLELFVFSKKETNVISKPIVSVSSFFLYDIVKHIAGKSVEIINILPFGVDPHSFELTPKIMSDIENSSLLFYSGAGLEPWVDNIVFSSKSIDMSKHVNLRELGVSEFEFHQHHDEQCAHNKLDPHYWLDFENMKKATQVVTDELISLLPKNREIYLQNRDEYIAKLEKLDTYYTQHLKSCRIKHLVLNHNSMGYLARKYGFHSEALSGLSPEAQPTPHDIKRIINAIEEDGINTIFFENFVNSKVMKTIAEDANVKVDVIESLGNITADEADINATYEMLMYKNLEKISKALVCH